MASKSDLETFKYFVECYFHSDVNYSEFENTVLKFKKMENEKYSINLLLGAKLILNKNDWGYIHDFVYKYAYRDYEIDKLIEMVWIIIRVLS